MTIQWVNQRSYIFFQDSIIEPLTISRNIKDTLWHHIVVTAEAGEIEFYFDGVLMDTR